MKQKIEITKDEFLELLKNKIDFVISEYDNLYNAFKYDEKKNKVSVDTFELTRSREKYLKQTGDIEIINNIYNKFIEQKKQKVND